MHPLSAWDVIYCICAVEALARCDLAFWKVHRRRILGHAPSLLPTYYLPYFYFDFNLKDHRV